MPLNPNVIPGLDVFEHDRVPTTPGPTPRVAPLPTPEVTEFERINPETLRPRLAGSGGVRPPTTPVTPPAPQSPSGGWLRRTADSAKGPAANPTARAVGGVAKALGRSALRLAPEAAVMEVGSHLGDYRINDPSVDSSVAGTYRSLRDGDLSGAGRSLSKGALEAMMDLGSGVANLADYVVPGKAPVSTAYDKTLRSHFGDQLVSHGIPTEPTSAGVMMPPPAKVSAAAAAGAPAQVDQPTVPNDPRAVGPHPNLTGPLAGVPKDLPPGMTPGTVYKTRDAAGNVTYSGKSVGEGATIADGMGTPTGRLGSGNALGPAAPGSMYDRELTSLRDLGAARAAADPGWGGGATGMGPSLRDIERKNAETTASSIDRRTAARGERQIASMDKQDITNTQAAAQRYGADAGLRGSMYAADRRLQGDLAQSQANTLRTQMEMQFKTGNRALMAQIYQQAKGNPKVAEQLALAYGLGDIAKEFGEANSRDQTAEARTQTTQGNAVDRVREDLKVYVPGKDGIPVEDKAASQANLDMIRNLFPDATGTDVENYEKNKAKYTALAGIFQAARRNQGVGVMDYTPWGNDPQNLTKLPNWKGATISKADGWRGFTTGHLSKGEHVLKTADGNEINLGPLDDTQVNLIREHAKTGKWN